MVRPEAEKLIQRASAGERLTTADRRYCISYLTATRPELSNIAMGDIFGVTEAAIRLDLKKIREDKAKLIREDDIGLVIADIALTFERQVQDIERSKNKSQIGSRTYLEHCRAIARMQVERVQLLQELGFYPKNLGNMTVNKFEYRAVVTKDGSVDTRRVDMGDVIEVAVEEPKQLMAPATSVEFDDNGNEEGDE